MTYDIPHFEGKLSDDLSGFLEERLIQARQAQQVLKQAKLAIEAELAIADEYVVDCEAQIKLLFGDSPSPKLDNSQDSATSRIVFSAKPKPASSYNPGWTHLDKIKYVLRNPLKYGFITFKGAGSVVKAIFVEEPNFRPDRNSAMIQVAPQLSRVVKNGDAVKVLALGSKVDYHFISADWFDETGQIKQQYQEAVAGLDLSSLKKD